MDKWALLAVVTAQMFQLAAIIWLYKNSVPWVVMEALQRDLNIHIVKYYKDIGKLTDEAQSNLRDHKDLVADIYNLQKEVLDLKSLVRCHIDQHIKGQREKKK
jgi:hypothetical protein